MRRFPLILLLVSRTAWAQVLPWSPYAASHLSTLAAGVLSGVRETTAAATTGRLVALADAQSTSVSVAAWGPRGGMRLVEDHVRAGAGAVDATQVEGAWRAASGVVLEGWSAYARLTVSPARVGRVAGGARVLFPAPSGPAGAWCGYRMRDRGGLFSDAGGVVAGVWWGAGARPQCACECAVSPDTRAVAGRFAASCPVGAGLHILLAASTTPSTLAMGVRADRGAVRLEVERTVNAVVGDGVRLSCTRVWR